MGTAYAVKNGDLDLKSVDSEYRDKIKDLVDGMTLKQLKDFAETKHEGLPEVKETVSHLNPNMNVQGMGAPAAPGNPGQMNNFTSQQTGSGDLLSTKGVKKPKKKKKKKSWLMTFEQFNNKNI